MNIRTGLGSAVSIAALLVASCGDSDDGSSGSTPIAGTASGATSVPDTTAEFPDVVSVEVTARGNGDHEVVVTISSPYDSPDRYADAWRVLDADGNELGVRELAHDHAAEQPFTRSLVLTIPDGVDEITVEGRDQVNGYGGTTASAPVPAAPNG